MNPYFKQHAIFNKDFDEEMGGENASSAQIEERIQRLSQEAYQQGEQDGLSKGLAQAEENILAQIRDLVPAIHEEILQMKEIREKMQKDILRDCLDFSQKVTSKITLNELHQRPQAYIVSVIKESLHFLSRPISLSLHVHPSLAPQMQALIAEIPGYESTDWKILPNETLSLFACQLKWEDGEIRHDLDHVFEKIEQLKMQEDLSNG